MRPEGSSVLACQELLHDDVDTHQVGLVAAPVGQLVPEVLLDVLGHEPHLNPEFLRLLGRYDGRDDDALRVRYEYVIILEPDLLEPPAGLLEALLDEVLDRREHAREYVVVLVRLESAGVVLQQPAVRGHEEYLVDDGGGGFPDHEEPGHVDGDEDGCEGDEEYPRVVVLA